MKKKPSAQKKMTAQQFKEARAALYESYGGVKKKKFKPLSDVGLHYDDDRGSKMYKSVISEKPAACVKNTVMSPENLAKESAEVRDAIIRKAQRVIPLYNKGNAMYATDLELGV